MRAVKVELDEAIRIAKLPMVAISSRQKKACFLPDDWRGIYKYDEFGYRVGATQSICYRGEIAIFDYDSHSIVGNGELKCILYSEDARDKDRPPLWATLGQHVVMNCACTWFFSSFKKLQIVTRVVSPKLANLKWKTDPLVWNLPCVNEWADLIVAEEPAAAGAKGDSRP
jgi:hypothetical protein